MIHPTNELLCSDIIPRWAVIGWLLTTCTSSVAVSNAKLALFYDWLFYNTDKDNIMNIEPAILVMHHSMRSHPAVSATLLDFLCRIIANFYPPLADKVRIGIFTSLRQILDKRVLPSLQPLFDNAKLDRELRNMIKDTFKEFCVAPTTESSSKNDEFMGAKMEDMENDAHVLITMNNHISDNEPAFSDDDEEENALMIHTPEDDTDDDDLPLSKVRMKEKTLEKSDDLQIDGPIKTTLGNLQHERDNDKRCQLMSVLVNHVADLDEDTEVLPMLGRSIHTVIQDDFKGEIFPKTVSDDALLNSVKLPLFVIFKTLCNFTKQESTGKQLILKLLTELHSRQPSLGYLLLYFLKVQVRTDNNRKDASALKVSVYKEFCQCLEKKIDNCLYDDLNACHINEHNLMMWIVPDLYRDFKQQTVNNAQILRVIVSTIDSAQLQNLICKIVQGRLVMFKSDNLQQLLKTSLQWESIEQFFIWQLIQAHDISVEAIVPLISHLDFKEHAEAVSSLILLLKQGKPSADVIKYLFSRDIRDRGDVLVFTLIKYWCENCMDKVGELISSLLSTRYPSTSPNKRKRSNNKSLSATVPSADQVLGHLEQIRSKCEKQDGLGLYNLEAMQKALQVAQNNSTDSQKKQFSELFALTEEEETSSSKGRSQGRGRKPAGKTANKRTTREVSESSEESSEVSYFYISNFALT